ncbi:hypothetical protein BGZ80_006626 [Entomortierella chlamydospora]|uniref:Uncharacterized protein n=1 Tax=Entomortierella chlamydospora TaxID=101097 RepID=A0A9P6N004_9FUNG|nr:hypothetical protein BGZ80_006626 [Entomortierella chlamydospora]
MANIRGAQSTRLTLQQKRHQFLTNSSSIDTPEPTARSNNKPQSNDHEQLPKDTLGAIQYLLDLLHPSKVKQQKVFPRACMVHQIYSIIQDHTTVDRALAQLIKDGTIRKFYLAGTGSDEFAIMLTSDYVAQIQQAKEEYLRDLQEASDLNHQQRRQDSTSTSNSTTGTSKRKLGGSNQLTASKKVVIENNSSTESSSRIGKQKATAPTNLVDQSHTGEGIFDRFKDLVIGGHCMEISIQHSNIQTPVGRGSNFNNNSGGSNSNHAGAHSALNQLIRATNQEQAKTIKSETTITSLVPSAAAATVVGGGTVTQAVAITATLGRRELISDDVAYRFSFRQGGLFVTQFLKGRLEILRMIKRQTFGDMLTSVGWMI